MIRPIQEKDYQGCLTIYNYYVLQTSVSLEEKEVSLEDFRKRIERISRQFIWLVATEKDKTVGYAYLDFFNPRSSYDITKDLSIYIAENERGKGYGSKLLEAVEKYASEHGVRNLISIITSENKESLAFHASRGFKEACLLENIAVKFKRSIGVYYYRKDIKPR
jgi:L-amino acid N-acyltransferase YncA